MAASTSFASVTSSGSSQGAKFPGKGNEPTKSIKRQADDTTRGHGPTTAKRFTFYTTPPKATSRDSRRSRSRTPSLDNDTSDDDESSDSDDTLPKNWERMMVAQAKHNAMLEKEELRELKKFLCTMEEYVECPKCGYCAPGHQWAKDNGLMDDDEGGDTDHTVQEGGNGKVAGGEA